MRAKIIVDTGLGKEELKALFPSFDKCRVFDISSDKAQGSKEGDAIYERVINTVADHDRSKAKAGKLFAFTHPLFDSEGMVSIEDDSYVIRILNEGIIALKGSCSNILQDLGNYCRINKRKIKFPAKISILEISGHRPVIDGKVLVRFRDRFKEARNQKYIEFLVSIIGILVITILLGISLAQYRYWNDINNRPWFAAWVLDILSKLIGSVVVTTLLSFLVFSTTLWDLSRYTIKWEIPEAGGTQ